MGSTNKRTSWLGGFIRYDKRGRPTFWIRRRFGDGRQAKVSTRCHTEQAALAELVLFEKDPVGYVPRIGGAAFIRLDTELARDFLKWSRDECGNTVEWITKQRNLLAWWGEVLKGMDLRHVSLGRHIIPALDEVETSRQKRIAVLKTLYAWLRKVRHSIATAEDPTFGQLVTPQTRPEQWKRDKAITLEQHERMMKHLGPGPWRDAATVLAGTGWHVTELERFVRTGRAEDRRRDADPEVAGLLICPQRKSGEPQRTEVTIVVLEAAQRLLERGVFGRSRFGMALSRACKAAKVEGFGPGSYRHSVATWAIERGAEVGKVSQFLGHKSARTTKRFYATHAVTPKVPTLK